MGAAPERPPAVKKIYWLILSNFGGWFFRFNGICNKSFAKSVYEPLNNTMITIITQAMTHYQAYAVLLTQMYTIYLEPSKILIKICKLNASDFSKLISEKGCRAIPPWDPYEYIP